jgi:3-hydroxyacyl-CoA dehydrogenase
MRHNGPIGFFSDFKAAVANADLVIESVPEDPSLKDFYKS